jgi:hypothetical protein
MGIEIQEMSILDGAVTVEHVYCIYETYVSQKKMVDIN